MRNKLGEIEFYDGRVKDILYYIPSCEVKE